MSTPTTSAAPSAPATSSPLRPITSFIEWFGYVRTWILGLSPAGSTVYDTGWQAITPSVGTGAEGFGVRRIGREVFIRGSITNATNYSTTAVKVATIPAGFRPYFYTRIIPTTGAGATNTALVANIQTNGDLEIAANGNSTTVARFAHSWFVD